MVHFDSEVELVGTVSTAVDHVGRRVDANDVQPGGAQREYRIAVAAAEFERWFAPASYEPFAHGGITWRGTQGPICLGDETVVELSWVIDHWTYVFIRRYRGRTHQPMVRLVQVVRSLFMRVEVVAIGTELLLGQIVDTNSSWIGQRLAMAGIDTHYQTKVGDNHDRIVGAIRLALSRSEAVICCGGLGPTQDDITRAALAEVMNVSLVRDLDMVETIRAMFEARGRVMAENNALQADKPIGAEYIRQTRGTAPGLICPVGQKVIYAVPGVPYEMTDMMDRAIVPDLQRRSGVTATIKSRTLRTWGAAESTIAEMVAPRLDALDASGAATIAFLASGIEGIKVRITAKAETEASVDGILQTEETQLREILGDLVFGIDDETMEHAVGTLMISNGWTMAVAESVTGGLVCSRIVNVPGASGWFRGGIVSYATEVKQELLGVGAGPVVSEAAAVAMAVGARDRLRADVGVAITGVAGPDPQDDQPVGTVWFGLAIPGEEPFARTVKMPGDRERIRQFSAISALDLLRQTIVRGAVDAPKS